MSTPGAFGEGITTTGTGEAPAPVDQVTVSLGVELTRPDAGEAFRAASATVGNLLRVLSDGGVDSRSVRTQDLTLGPRTDWKDGRQDVLGYAAGQRILVVLQSLRGIEQLLTDVATRSGEGVRIDGVALSAGDTGPAARQARERAFADAREKAEHFAALAGRTLGRAVSVQEDAHHAGARVFGGAPAVLAASAGSMPMATGDTSITASVTVTWAFDH